MNMPESFAVITRFLERFSDDVEGRQASELSEETKQQLKKLARGELPRGEHEPLFAILRTDPTAVSWLAEEVKVLRSKRE